MMANNVLIKTKMKNIYKITMFIIRFAPAILAIYFGFMKVMGWQFKSNAVNCEGLKNIHNPDIVFLFFGNSGIYIWFIGLIQFLSGGLLLFKKTSLIGALFCFVIFLNILLINISFGFAPALTLIIGIMNLFCLITIVINKNKIFNLLIDKVV